MFCPLLIVDYNSFGGDQKKNSDVQLTKVTKHHYLSKS